MVSPGDLDDDRLTAAGAGAQVRVGLAGAPSDRGTDRCIHGRSLRWGLAGLQASNWTCTFLQQ
jgi:hypothetical protein